MGVEIARPPLTAPGRGRRSAASPLESSLPTPYAPRRAPKPGREHRLKTAYHEQTPLFRWGKSLASENLPLEEILRVVVARGVWGFALDPKAAHQVDASYSITTGLGCANHARANRTNEMAYSTGWAKRLLATGAAE